MAITPEAIDGMSLKQLRRLLSKNNVEYNAQDDLASLKQRALVLTKGEALPADEELPTPPVVGSTKLEPEPADEEESNVEEIPPTPPPPPPPPVPQKKTPEKKTPQAPAPVPSPVSAPSPNQIDNFKEVMARRQARRDRNKKAPVSSATDARQSAKEILLSAQQERERLLAACKKECDAKIAEAEEACRKMLDKARGQIENMRTTNNAAVRPRVFKGKDKS